MSYRTTHGCYDTGLSEINFQTDGWVESGKGSLSDFVLLLSIRPRSGREEVPVNAVSAVQYIDEVQPGFEVNRAKIRGIDEGKIELVEGAQAVMFRIGEVVVAG